MTRVGFITSPLSSAHSARGIGFYVKRLLPELKKQAVDFGFEIIEVENSVQISNFKFQIVHYPYFDPFYHTLPILKNCQTVVTIHDVIPLEFPDQYPPGLKGRLNLQLQKMALSLVNRVITDSYASVQAIRKYLHVPHEKIKLVYLAADKKIKKILKPKNKFKLPKKFVLYVGDINYNKNIPYLISACKLINLPLVIVGKQAVEIENLKPSPSGLFSPQDLVRNFFGRSHPQLKHLEILKEEFQNKNIIRLGFVDDLTDIYSQAAVYCQPSFAEGFGLPILEALASDTPVACSDIPVFHEIADDAATYFDPSNIDSIAQAIKIAKPKNGPAQAAKFSWEKAAVQTLQVYQELT